MSEIVAIMTTYERLDLLRQTVQSYCAAESGPEMHVFDDCTKDQQALAELVMKLPKATLHVNERRIGCDPNTPAAIKWVFEHDSKCEYVIVLDSDIAFAQDWYAVTLRAIERMKQNKKIAAIQLLNLDNIGGKVEPPRFREMLKCKTLTACGMIVTRDYLKNFIEPCEDRGWWRWDMTSAETAVACGYDVYCLAESAIQHMGFHSGTHAGANQVSSTYRGGVIIDPPGVVGRDMLVVAGEGFCNCALAAMLKIVLEKMGKRVRIAVVGDEWQAFIKTLFGKDTPWTKPFGHIETRHGEIVCDPGAVIQTAGARFTPIIVWNRVNQNRWLIYAMDRDINMYLAHVLYRDTGLEVTEFPWHELRSNDIQPRTIASGTCVVRASDNEMPTIKEFVGGKSMLRLFVGRMSRTQKDYDKYVVAATPIETVAVIKGASEFVTVNDDVSFASLFTDTTRVQFASTDGYALELPESNVVGVVSPRPSNVTCVADKGTSDLLEKLCGLAANPESADYEVAVTGEVRGFYKGFIADLAQDCPQGGSVEARILGVGGKCVLMDLKNKTNAPKHVVSESCLLIGGEL